MIRSLAWRNIWRNRTRSLVVITAIALGIVSALVLDAFYLGMINTFIEDSINKTTAHIQIHQPEFLEDEDVRFVIEDSDEILSSLDRLDGIRSSSTRIVVNAMLGTSRTTRSVRIKGIDPERELSVADLKPYIEEGEYFGDRVRNPILLSTRLAGKTGVKLGSKVVLTFQDMEGEITSGLFRITGLFDTGNDMVDESIAFVRRDDMVQTIDVNGAINGSIDHEIAVLLTDIDDVDTTAATLKRLYPHLTTRTYREIAPELDLYESQLDVMTWFYFVIIMAALIFGIINTMLMAVLERYREFGVLMSLGMERGKMFRLVILETLALCFTATPIGIVVGFGIIYLMSQTGIDLSMWSEMLEQYGMASMIYPEVNPKSFVRLIFAISFTSILAAIYPAWKAIRLNPLEAIRKI